MKKYYKTALLSMILLQGCDSKKIEQNPLPPASKSSIVQSRIKDNKEDELNRYGYAVYEPQTYNYFNLIWFKGSISAVTFQTIKGDNFNKLAELIYGKREYDTLEQAKENLVFHKDNYESRNIKYRKLPEYYFIKEGTNLRTYFWNRNINIFTNNHPERNLQILQNTPEYFAADNGYGQKITEIGDLIRAGRDEYLFISFKTLSGDTLESLAELLYRKDFFSYSHLAFQEVYENPEVEKFSKDQSLPSNLLIRTFMAPYQYEAFTNHFPDRQAQIIPPQLSPNLMKLFSRAK